MCSNLAYILPYKQMIWQRHQWVDSQTGFLLLTENHKARHAAITLCLQPLAQIDNDGEKIYMWTKAPNDW